MKRSVFVIGLTGSIGMGKSTASAMLRRKGLPIFDADATVHQLMGVGGSAVSAVEEAFPGVVKNGASTCHCSRARTGLRMNAKSFVRNGNCFTEGLSVLWSGGSIQFIPTLNSGKFGLGCRGFWSSVRYRSILRSWLPD